MGISKYGLNWDDSYDHLKIEMFMIRRGGQWTKDGRTFGNGLSFHYEAMRKLLWPHLDTHRWHELCRDEILGSKTVCILGPGSAGKTHEASWVFLCEYLCWPYETLVMVSSTDMRGLRLRVWGEISDLWQKALDRYDYLPGHLIDSRVAITTDSLEDEDGYDEDRRVRDMRKGIIGIPTIQGNKQVGLGKWCFPAGQMVDTPNGQVPIEQLKIGDLVLSAAGPSKILNTFSRIAPKLVRIKLSDERQIDCTPDHPILTDSGWVNACCISKDRVVFSAHETMYCLRERQRQKREILLPRLSEVVMAQTVSSMWKSVCAIGTASAILYSKLRGYLENGATWNNRENDGGKRFCSDWEGHQCGHQEKSERDEAAGRICASANQDTRISALQLQEQNNRRGYFSERFSECDTQSKSIDWPFCKVGIPADVSYRRSVSRNNARRRDRWEEPPGIRAETKGHREGQISFGTRVDGVEVLECGSDSRYSKSEGGYRVYDLQIESHPSFSVNGVIVHNCGVKQKRVRLIADEAQMMGPSFLSAFSNLNKNVDFRAVVIGNPVDTMDPLGCAAEPKDGWGTETMDVLKTSVWDTKFLGGRCVNLIGTDSPNFDYPDGKTRFPYLISKEKIDETLSFFPKDSVEYYSQCIGSMKISLMAKRIITRLMCKQFGAMLPPHWKGTHRIRIASLDAAYGGDRCMFGWGEFGDDVDGKQIIAVNKPVEIPILVGKEEPEEQIAKFVKRMCEKYDIPPENFFHDSTGRGSLGTALARAWSAATNPVEFGGKPTNRPVSLDMFIRDPETGLMRLKLACEHYYNFVTELWYSVRYTIEAGQMRNLSEEVMDEGCKREWESVPRAGTKVIQAEPKEEMKLRTRQSPDQFDQLVILVEGARQRGFQISKLANVAHTEDDDDIDDGEQEFKDVLKRSLLNHALA